MRIGCSSTRLLASLCALIMSVRASAATFVVTNTLPSGPGSFSQALTDAYFSPGVDVIDLSKVCGDITPTYLPGTFADTIITGPGANLLTITIGQWMIHSATTTTISGITLASYPSGTPGGNGGVVFNAGTLFLRDCEVVGGYLICGKGAGIYNTGNLTISGSTIANNRAESCPYADFAQCASGIGGGLYVSSGNVLITNSTFSGNSATSFNYCEGEGGGIYVETGTVYLVNCTLAGNSAHYGGAILASHGTVTLLNSIVTDPTVGVTSVSGNLFTNLISAGLGPLQNNGGPTPTHALAPNSQAINHGVTLGAPPIDQRGVTRPQGTRPDAGAFEFERGTNFFQLDLAAAGPGTFSRSPDLVFFPSNSVVAIIARPIEDYALAQWSGDATGQDNPIFIRMDRDKSIGASYVYAPATVTNAPGRTNYVSNTDAWGPGSFRQALRDLNASGGGVIRFSSVTGTINLLSGLPPVQANVQIDGPDSSNLVLYVPYGADAFTFSSNVTGSISGVTIQSTQPPGRSGGAIFNEGNLALRSVRFSNCGATTGGAIFNTGTLQICDCVFEQNAARSGGAIYNKGGLEVTASVFAGNQSFTSYENTGGGGALYHEAGDAIFARCKFTGNAGVGLSGAPETTSLDDIAVGGAAYAYVGSINGGATFGGALYVAAGSVGLSDTLVASNTTRGGSGTTTEFGHFSGNGGSAVGAGIYLRNGSLKLTNCALINNLAVAGDSPGASRYHGIGGPAGGGGIGIYTGIVYAINCTLSGNEVRSGNTGGGGFSGDPGGGRNGSGGAIGAGYGSVTLANCTITSNRAFPGHSGGWYGTTFGQGFGGGISVYSPGTVALLNTIVSGNSGTTMGTNGIVADDAYGPGSSLGHNLIGSSSNFVTLASDLIGVQPELGPLQDNGGPTPTHALLATSPAIDAGAPSILSFDQRGQPRSVDNPAIPNRLGSDGTDIGALEVNHILTLTGLSKVGSNVHLSFTSVSDKIYRLEYKSSLTDSSWIVIPGVIAGTGGIVTATNFGAGLSPSRFYRAFQ